MVSLLYNIEFLMANLKKNDYTNIENLKMAFDFFDENNDGSISLAELKRVFLGNDDELILSSIMAQADTNNDGEVTIIIRNRFHIKNLPI